MSKEPSLQESFRYLSNTRSDYKLTNKSLIKRFAKTRSRVWIRKGDTFSNVSKSNSSFSYSFNVLGIVVVILLIGAVASSLGNGEPKTLYGLLLMLENTSTIPMDWLNWQPLDLSGWGWFEWLANFVEFGYGAINLLFFAGVSLLNLFPFIMSVVKWFFI